MDTIAFFYSTDDQPKFAYVLCNESTLSETILKTLYHDPSEDDRAEAVSHAVHLMENLGMDFEDGWIAVRIGMKDVAEFLMEKVKEQASEAAWSDGERYKELQRRQKAEDRFNALRGALVDALGDKGPEIAAKAA